ncbi:hypothetical protein [Microcoleus sp. Pol12B5]|uniref:hypothetical protein n=1 Tax=Microcoleus sp. Pol12B5 TaxID=3055396 RepID=UPI002FD43141
MSTPQTTSQRRIDRLKATALNLGFTKEYAKRYGKLSKTATWETLLNSYGVKLPEHDTPAQPISNSNIQSDFVRQPTPVNFFRWVDFPQLIALTLASAGLFVLARPLLQHISPSKLFQLPPVQINIKIGAK